MCCLDSFLKAGICLLLVCVSGAVVVTLRCIMAAWAYIESDAGDWDPSHVLNSAEFWDWGEWSYWVAALVLVALAWVIFLVPIICWDRSKCFCGYFTEWMCCSAEFRRDGHCDGVFCLVAVFLGEKCCICCADDEMCRAADYESDDGTCGEEEMIQKYPEL